MKPEREWTWVHYKILEESCDEPNLPSLLLEAIFHTFPGGDARIPGTSREETEAAVLDLLAAGAVDLFDGGERLNPESAVEVARSESSWRFDLRAAKVEIVENAATSVFLARRSEGRDPYVREGKAKGL